MSPLVMGVLNVTPDSFSDGGRYVDTGAAVARGRDLVAEGADIVDVGGESTRPGATPVSVDEEIARVVPVVEALADHVAESGARLSVDTRHAAVAEAAVGAGASIVNDVSASLEATAAESGAGWIAMHMAGEPGSMQDDPRYDDVVGEVLDHLTDAAARGRAAGVDELWIDPGIGFGKTFDHNWSLLASLHRFVDTGVPVAVGTSRKGFLGTALAEADGVEGSVPVDDRLEGSLTTAVWSASVGAALLRVHDVAATRAALRGAGAVALAAGGGR